MSEFLSINGEQERIFKKMYNVHTLNIKRKVQNIIQSASEVEQLQAILEELIALNNEAIDSLCTLPMRRNIGQHISPAGNPKALSYTGTGTMMVKDGSRSEFFELPGCSTIGGVQSAYDALEDLIEFYPTAISDIKEKLEYTRFSPAAGTPYREIGLLRDILSIEQMNQFALVLDIQVGTIDLHQFKKKDAAIILDVFRKRMGFTIGSDCAMKYMYQGGTSDWYGKGDNDNGRNRDLVRNIAGSSTTKPSDRIARWLKSVENLDE